MGQVVVEEIEGNLYFLMQVMVIKILLRSSLDKGDCFTVPVNCTFKGGMP
jgi:hypothetical protein